MIRERESDGLKSVPITPTGMTVSKSSKSSSFQSLRSDDGSVLGDASHFEDIGLEEDDVTLKSPSQLNVHRLPSPAPSSSTGRTLAANRPSPKPRSSFPNLRNNIHTSNPRSTSLAVLTDPSTIRRSNSHSTPSLPRYRSPSPGLSLNPRDPNLNPRPRRGSWQSNHRDRRSFAELERECDEDEGDDIPDGLVLDNVPISPRAVNDRPPSRTPSLSPSPNREPKERVRSVGNGTPPVAQAQGSLRSPTWKTEAALRERSPTGPLTPRAQSWNAAHADLSAETRALTEKLEQYADDNEAQQNQRPPVSARPNTWDASRTASDYALNKKQRIKSTPELPPLRRTNVMIDPLPVSKEKEAVLSRTRPSWLPPKDPAEERRHLRQYQKMMAASAKADERREAARRSKSEVKDVATDGYMQIWEREVINRWDDAIRERRTRELWWRGIPPRSRGVVWRRAIGNELGLSETSFSTALARAHDVEARVHDDRATPEDTQRAQWFADIRSEVAERTWRDLRIFGNGGPLQQALTDVLMAYVMYRNDIGYVSGYNTIAALLLLNLPTPSEAFIAFANVLNRPLPLAFYTSDTGAQHSAYNLVLETLRTKSRSLFDHLSRGIPELEPEVLLGQLFGTLFTSHLAVDSAARLWDIYVFEGDALLVRAALALLLKKEMALLGSHTREEVQSVMLGSDRGTENPRKETAVGEEDSFIKAVREAGKA